MDHQLIRAPESGARQRMLVERLASLDEYVDGEGSRTVRAPGRVNLIGEHTDYNLGYVMPAAITLDTWMASVPRGDRLVRVHSMQANETAEFQLDAVGEPRGHWVDYVAGVAKVLVQGGVGLRGVNAVIDSTIPQGAGLSSSAALELATAWTLSESVPPPLPTMELAKAAQRAENEHVGVQSGLMDQFASSHGQAGHALLFDCRSLDYRPMPLPAGHTLVALDSRVEHKLGASEYNARREQCDRGVAAISRRYPRVRSLRDVTLEMLKSAEKHLDAETYSRCQHVVEENSRVLDAARAFEQGDLDAVGRLFAASHESLRDLYEVSSPELDALVAIATSVPGVVGSRMTGAGFGGCTVNIVRDEAVDDLRAAVEREYPRRIGHAAGFYVVGAVDGAGLTGL